MKFKTILFSLILFSQTLFAQSIPLKIHIQNYFLAYQNNSEIRLNLGDYVSDLNYILYKNTNKQFYFDPWNDVIYHNGALSYSHYTSYFPRTGYQVWLDINFTDFNSSYGGFLDYNSSGEAVLGGLYWKKIYNPWNTPNLEDYWKQITTVLHEYAHVFGAGIGEYYNTTFVPDNTGVNPYDFLSILDQSNPFWSYKGDFIYDPLTWNIFNRYECGYPTTRSQLLLTTRYSNLTSYLINQNFRYPNTTINLSDYIQISIIDSSGNPISNAKVDIYNNSGVLLETLYTGYFGIVLYNWNYDITSWDILRIAKINKPGYPNKSRWFGIYDFQIATMNGQFPPVIWIVM